MVLRCAMKLGCALVLLVCAFTASAQLQFDDSGSDEPCFLDPEGAGSANDIDCNPYADSSGSNDYRYHTSNSSLYLHWTTEGPMPSDCLSYQLDYVFELGGLYLCGVHWDQSEVQVTEIRWTSSSTPPSTGFGFDSGWTGVYESQLKFLHLIWLSGTGPWAGDPSASGGLPD